MYKDYMHIFIDIYTLMYTNRLHGKRIFLFSCGLRLPSKRIYIYIYTYIYTYMYTLIYIYKYIHIRVYTPSQYMLSQASSLMLLFRSTKIPESN
jgi:hypothetical protein